MALTIETLRTWAKIQPGSITDDDLQATLDGESANQAKVCEIPVSGVLPPDLELALRYRVARSVARRMVPLGPISGVGDGAQGSALVAALDPDITRLEFPYRKLPAA